MHLSEAAVQGFGRVQERGGRADRAKQAGRITCDVLGLADTGDVDAAAAAERGANYLDGARDGGDVQSAAHRGKFRQREVEKFSDFAFAGRVADSRFARLAIEAGSGQGDRLAIQVENFFAHVESSRKRTKARDRDRSGGIGEPPDPVPRHPEPKAGEDAGEERVAGAG